MDDTIWRTIQNSIQSQRGDDNPSRVARNVVHALWLAGYKIEKMVGEGPNVLFPGGPGIGKSWTGKEMED